MPFIGLLNGEKVTPAGVDYNQRVECPDCGDEMGIRDGQWRVRHFWHLHGRGTSCGESDKHKRMKAIAASKAHEQWPNAEIEIALEQQIDNRVADVLVDFPEVHRPYGDSLAIEVQYKNKGKDRIAWENDAHSRNVSVLWLEEHHFSKHNVCLSDGEFSPAWPSNVPQPDDWDSHTAKELLDDIEQSWSRRITVPNFDWVNHLPDVSDRPGYHGIIEWLRQDKPKNVNLNVDLPEPAIKKLLYPYWARGRIQDHIKNGQGIRKVLQVTHPGWFFIGLYVNERGRPHIQINHRSETDDRVLLFEWTDFAHLDLQKLKRCRSRTNNLLNRENEFVIDGMYSKLAIIYREASIHIQTRNSNHQRSSKISARLACYTYDFIKILSKLADLLPIHRKPETWGNGRVALEQSEKTKAD